MSLRISLTQEERGKLLKITKMEKYSSMTLRNAYILLNCDKGQNSPHFSSADIQKFLDITRPTFDKVRKKFLEEGLDAALERKPTDRVYKYKISPNRKKAIVDLYNSLGKENGTSKLSLRKFAKIVEVKFEKISLETIRMLLKNG